MKQENEKSELLFNPTSFMLDIRSACGEGKSLRDIAAHCHISAATLSRIDSGMTPDMNSFIAICSALELKPGDYFVVARWQRIE